MTKYNVSGKTIFVEGYGKTYFFNDEDLKWLDQGGVPRKNKDGYLIMPYGHKDGVEVYPEIHSTPASTQPKVEDFPVERWQELQRKSFRNMRNKYSRRARLLGNKNPFKEMTLEEKIELDELNLLRTATFAGRLHIHAKLADVYDTPGNAAMSYNEVFTSRKDFWQWFHDNDIDLFRMQLTVNGERIEKETGKRGGTCGYPAQINNIKYSLQLADPNFKKGK